MLKLLSNGKWYFEISPNSSYESEFENVILGQSHLLFPNQIVLPFKITVYSENGSAKPDFALIDKDYRRWWIIEVEMGTHPLYGHVIPQIEVLAQASYGEREAIFLCKESKKLDLERVLDMMKGKSPQVILIVDFPVPEWEKILLKYEVLVLVLQIFRSDDNRHIFKVHGEFPSLMDEDTLVSECCFDPSIPRFLALDSPSVLELPKKRKINIMCNGTITQWERIDVQNKIWLSPLGLNPLKRGITYLLIKKSDNSFEIKPK